MSNQEKDYPCNPTQKQILDLEKKYYNKIKAVIQSRSFIFDLLLIEKEIRENYSEYDKIWDLKNKLKIPAERLVRHHIYMDWHDEIEGIYPSPVSSDLGIRMKDCVICIDVKTIDIVGNRSDLKSTATEKNQNSFQNSEYPVFKYKSNLKSIDHYSRRPVLTFLVKIVYRDNDYGFQLARVDYPTIVLTCIPNGELSPLFGNNIIENFKTYAYYGEKDGAYYKPFDISGKDLKNPETKRLTDAEFIGRRGFIDLSNDESIGKIAYYDIKKQQLWWVVHSGKRTTISAVKDGSSVRYSNTLLEKRFDSNGDSWTAYEEFNVEEEL